MHTKTLARLIAIAIATITLLPVASRAQVESFDLNNSSYLDNILGQVGAQPQSRGTNGMYQTFMANGLLKESDWSQPLFSATYNYSGKDSKLADDARLAMVQAQSQFDTAQRHLETLQQVGQREQIRGAEAQVAAAQAHYQSAAAQVSFAEVRSPISGIVSDRPVEFT